jgi:tetratricopeptide (TPR) repeat protein
MNNLALLKRLSLLVFFMLAASSAFCDYTTAAVKRDLDRGHYENIMAEYEADLAELKQDGSSQKLFEFYEQFVAYEDQKGLTEWTHAQPSNPVPWTATGLRFLFQGEGARGQGFAERMNKDQTDLYVGKITQATVYFKKAISLNPEDPYACDGMIQAARHIPMPETEVIGYYQQALQIMPNMGSIIWDMGLYYSPMWSGTAEKMMKFIQKNAVSQPKGSSARLLIIRYYEDLSFSKYGTGTYFYGRSEWEYMKKEFEGFLEVHPSDRRVRTWYSYAAFCGKHYAEANQAFNWLGEQRMGDGYWTDVEYVKAKTAAKYRYEQDAPNNIEPPTLR